MSSFEQSRLIAVDSSARVVKVYMACLLLCVILKVHIYNINAYLFVENSCIIVALLLVEGAFVGLFVKVGFIVEGLLVEGSFVCLFVKVGFIVVGLLVEGAFVGLFVEVGFIVVGLLVEGAFVGALLGAC